MACRILSFDCGAHADETPGAGTINVLSPRMFQRGADRDGLDPIADTVLQIKRVARSQNIGEAVVEEIIDVGVRGA